MFRNVCIAFLVVLKIKVQFSAIFSLFGALSTHIHIEGLSNVPAFIHLILTLCATHSNLQIMPLFLVLFNYVGFHPSFSRHGITRASSVLLIWLNENVLFPTLVLLHQFMVLTFLAVFLVHILGLFLSQQKVGQQTKRTASVVLMRFFKGIMLATLGKSASRELEESRWGLQPIEFGYRTMDAPFHHLYDDFHPRLWFCFVNIWRFWCVSTTSRCVSTTSRCSSAASRCGSATSRRGSATSRCSSATSRCGSTASRCAGVWFGDRGRLIERVVWEHTWGCWFVRIVVRERIGVVLVFGH